MTDPGSEYDRYVRTEWKLFEADPSSRRTALEAVSDIRVRRVLDVGCGAGQMLTPFIGPQDTFGIGIDVNEEVGRAGRDLLAARHPHARAGFARARAEALPFPADSFDVVICRLALPYTDNVRALGEMARVLRPGGRLLLKIHHWRFYVSEMLNSAGARKVRFIVHDVRVLAAGALYLLTGRQPRNRILGNESFQTRGLLNRELAPLGLSIRGILPGSPAETPEFVIEKGIRAPNVTHPPMERQP